MTSEQEDYARGFVDALNNLRNSEHSNQQPTQQQSQENQQNNNSTNEILPKTGAIVSNPSIITTTPATTSSILSTVGMSGGSVTYTNLGRKINIFFRFYFTKFFALFCVRADFFLFFFFVSLS